MSTVGVGAEVTAAPMEEGGSTTNFAKVHPEKESGNYNDAGGYPFEGFKEKHFLLNESYVNLNHGSFGTVPSIVFDAHVSFLREQESRPDEWFRNKYYKLVDESRRVISQLINARTEDVVLVENASAAVNSILRSSVYKVIVCERDPSRVTVVDVARRQSSVVFQCLYHGDRNVGLVTRYSRY
jgi:hypothetical protein